ncbi:hypothetical protein Patl1_03893 [Pistacia atlantica]|uniref:Uncharacterized protein n=1 Tax=Pistacia atlantica TaxID=434234 RepID=A0ACC1BX18_9ROSI|nr:hypothetical protein Patl1_03893 [Pistacia atlantica]
MLLMSGVDNKEVVTAERLGGEEEEQQRNCLDMGHHHELRASQMENSIYTLLTIDRWESLNHMDYNLASLRPVYVKLALRFVNWVWFGTQSLETLALFNSSCSC